MRKPRDSHQGLGGQQSLVKNPDPAGGEFPGVWLALGEAPAFVNPYPLARDSAWGWGLPAHGRDAPRFPILLNR